MEVRGLMTPTATSMFRRVFLKTPTSCSSTKLAELSKPLMPSRAAENPRAMAINNPFPVGRVLRFSAKTEKSQGMLKKPIIINVARVPMWKKKIQSATMADSVMPMMARVANTARTSIVPWVSAEVGIKGIDIVHCGIGRDHRRCDIGEDGHTGGQGRCKFRCTVKQAVIGAPVKGQGFNHLCIDLFIKIENKDDHQEDQRRQDSGKYRCNGRHIQAGGGDVVTADSGGKPLIQPLFTGRSHK